MIDDLAPHSVFILKLHKRGDVLLKRTEHSIELRVILRKIRQREGEAQRGKCVTASPRGFGQRRMPVKAVRPEVQLLHESEMPRRHIEIFAVARKLAGFGEKRNSHEYGIAHLLVERHRLLHFTVFGEAKVGRAPNNLDETIVL